MMKENDGMEEAKCWELDHLIAILRFAQSASLKIRRCVLNRGSRIRYSEIRMDFQNDSHQHLTSVGFASTDSTDHRFPQPQTDVSGGQTMLYKVSPDNRVR